MIHNNIPSDILSTLHKPPICTREMPVYPFGKYADEEEAVDLLLADENLLLLHSYADGLRLLAALKQRIGKRAKGFQDKRQKRSRFQKASQHVLVEIEQQCIKLKKAPQIPFLRLFYPEEPHFVLSFPHLQGLNSAWQWYQKGISVPGLKGKLHPFYGAYFPTRFEHIELFNHYLNMQDINGKTAIDVGVGSGILSLLLLQAGISQLQGTDCNPNALYSSAQSFSKFGYHQQVKLINCDLMSACEAPADLIIFNPPWLEATPHNKSLDQAMYYTPGLFERFFAQAERFLSAQGEIVVLFSQLGQSSGHQNTHPIQQIMQNNSVWQLKDYKDKRCYPSKKSETNSWRSRQHEEVVELWQIVRR